jgi:arsenate reductase
MKKRVLILCTGNSCRSQMAEGLWRAQGGESWDCHSAGSKPAGYVHPLAIQVLSEIGIDISKHSSKHIAEFQNDSFDLVVTVCDSARESCPVVPSAKQSLHWPFEDPSLTVGSEDDRLEAFRTARDRIQRRLGQFLTRGL